ncbi:MAG: hypothetical protein IJV12_00390 [Acidaminococcaceae bacterium]|nr:hypothetical protein [Acidaminococcaceae bacterium]
MKLATLKDYSQKTGLPIRTLRRFCQEGIMPAMQVGRKYYIDESAADVELANTVQQETRRKKIRIVEPEMCRAKKFDFLGELAKA